MGNINISWIRRSRIDSDWRDYADAALGEESEKYEIDIKKKKTLIKTLTTNIPEVTYTAQLPLEDLTATIYQLSTQIGRGYGITISL